MKAPRAEFFLVLILAAIQFSHIVDFVVLMPLGPVLMRELSINPTQFALLVSAYNISAAIAGFIYSIFADKYPRKKMLIFCFLGFILGTLLCGVSYSFDLLLTARVIAGAFGGILTSIVYAIATDAIPFQRRGSAMGTIMSAFSIASIFGVPAGLFVSEVFSWQFTFILIAVVSSIVLALSCYIVPVIPATDSSMTPKQNLKRLLLLLTNKDYLKAFFLVGLNVLSIFMIIPFIAPYATKNVGLLESDLKYIYLIGGIFTVISANILGRLTDRFTPIKVLTLLIPISLIPIIIATRLGPVPLFFYLCVSSAFMMSVSGRMIPLMTMVSEVSQLKDRGSFMGLLNSMRSLFSSLATLIAGFIIYESDNKLVGYSSVGNISAVLAIIVLIAAMHVNRNLKKETLQ